MNPHDAFQGFICLFSLVHMHARVCMCVFVCLCALCVCTCLRKLEEDRHTLEQELWAPNMGAGNWSLVLCTISKCSHNSCALSVVLNLHEFNSLKCIPYSCVWPIYVLPASSLLYLNLRVILSCFFFCVYVCVTAQEYVRICWDINIRREKIIGVLHICLCLLSWFKRLQPPAR